MKMMVKIELVSQNIKLVYVTDKHLPYYDIYQLTADTKKIFFDVESPIRTSIEVKEMCHGEEEN